MNIKPDERKSRNAERLALGLGWCSIALGFAEIAAPRRVARLIGAAEDGATDAVLRTMGAREIAGGLAILSHPGEARWLWTRVGGDLVGLSSLGAAFKAEHSDAGRLSATAATVLGVAALDVMAARQLSRAGVQRDSDGVRIEQAVTINRSITTGSSRR